MKLLLIIISVASLAAIIYVVLTTTNSPSETGIVFVPEGQSRQRVSNLGLRQTSTNDPGILNLTDIRFPEKKELQDEVNYRAIPEIEWIVDIIPLNGFKFTKNSFLEVFDQTWGADHPAQFYAHFPSNNRWSFAISADSPEEFDSLEMAVQLAGVFDEQALTRQKLESYLTELDVRLKKFPAGFRVVAREAPALAAIRSAEMRKLTSETQSEIVIVLKSDNHFKSTQFWNTLVDLGLEWGDGDVFHWENPRSDFGDSYLFDVWTTTAPGYFLPEEVVANTCNPSDLVFGFSIPRSPDPERVYETMVEAVLYCQQKLGGEVLDENGKSFDRNLHRLRVTNTVGKLKEVNLQPGEVVSLRLF
jgi:cell division protein ZipA